MYDVLIKLIPLATVITEINFHSDIFLGVRLTAISAWVDRSDNVSTPRSDIFYTHFSVLINILEAVNYYEISHLRLVDGVFNSIWFCDVQWRILDPNERLIVAG